MAKPWMLLSLGGRAWPAVNIICSQGAMVVKRNQRTLYEVIGLFFSFLLPATVFDATNALAWGYEKVTTMDKAHGRLEVELTLAYEPLYSN